MGSINTSDINNANASIFSYGTKSKENTNLPSSLQSQTGNNVTKGNKITPVSIENIKSAIKILEQKFSLNCCQSNCNSTSTKCQETTCQAITGTSTSCQSKKCQYCQSQCRYSDYDNCSD